MRTVKYIFSVVMILCLFSSGYCMAAKAAKKEKWPGNVSPESVYKVTVRLNRYADALLKKKHIKQWQKLPEVNDKVSTRVVFQLHLATIEMLHNYEIQLGMRPLPIVTSSPIKYYPVDVKFLSDLILQRMKKIARHFSVRVPPMRMPKVKKAHASHAVYLNMLRFYMKLSALNGIKELGSNEVFSQLYRANEDLKGIMLFYVRNETSPNKKRSLASSIYGMNPFGKPLTHTKTEKSPHDTYLQCIKIRKLMLPFLKKHELTLLPIPKEEHQGIFKPIDAFIQSQIIISDLGAWKGILGKHSSTPIAIHAHNKTPKDAYQEASMMLYMLERLQKVL